MSTWIKVDYSFDVPQALLTVGMRSQDLIWKEICPMLQIEEKDISKIASRLEALVVKYRPGLVGGSVVGVNVDPRSREVCIWYIHPSFDRVPLFQSPPRINLILQKGEMDTAYIEDDVGIGRIVEIGPQDGPIALVIRSNE